MIGSAEQKNGNARLRKVELLAKEHLHGLVKLREEDGKIIVNMSIYELDTNPFLSRMQQIDLSYESTTIAPLEMGPRLEMCFIERK